MNQAQIDFENFRSCADNAPEGAYEHAKQLRDTLSLSMSFLINEVRALGFRTDNCDHAHRLESAMYAYVSASNPSHTLFPTAEGFGASMDGPARDRVLQQTADNVATLRALGAL